MEKIISKNIITAIPGIGTKYAKRLDAVGIKKVSKPQKLNTFSSIAAKIRNKISLSLVNSFVFYLFDLQPRDLLKQYEKLDKDPHRFVHWMKKQCHANVGHAKKTVDVVKHFSADQREMQNPIGEAHKNYSLITPKLLRSSIASAPNAAIKSPVALASVVDDQLPLANDEAKSSESNDNGKDALNQHLFKLREQFSNMHDTAKQKMLELQSELGKMQHMSHEFDVLAEFLTSEEKLSIFEQNLDRLQHTVRLTETRIQEINVNNQKMGRMIRQINETAKKQHENNDKAIGAIGDRLARLELKLDRVTKKIGNQKIGIEEFKLNKDDYAQLKDDIEQMLNTRMMELSRNMENMRNVVFCIVSLIVLKMFVFDLFKNDINREMNDSEME